MKRIGLDLISGNLTTSNKSHKAGWAYLRKCQLESSLNRSIDVLHENKSWDDYDIIMLYHGMEQTGETLNLFGGATEQNAKFYERLLTDKLIYSLDISMPDYGKMCKNRLKNCDEYWSSINWDIISEKCKNIKSIGQPKTNKLVIGDSHAFSVYTSGAAVSRNDHKTLHGALKLGIKSFLPQHDITHLTSYFGNIDIRHHLCRFSDPKNVLKDMLKTYEIQLKDVNIAGIELVSPLPIEDESRRLPKTGYFKDTPFYGSREERMNLVEYMKDELNNICSKNGWNLFTWPEEWYKMNPVDYMKTYMESKQSVHLAPVYHRWNYWENKLNTLED